MFKFMLKEMEEDCKREFALYNSFESSEDSLLRSLKSELIYFLFFFIKVFFHLLLKRWNKNDLYACKSLFTW